MPSRWCRSLRKRWSRSWRRPAARASRWSRTSLNIKNADWDLEAFANVEYGKHQMDLLAECMKGEGQYAVFVGSLTSKTHNEWVDGAIARQKEKYPNMELVGDRNETYDDQQQAYAKTQELLRKYPNLKGFKGSASTDVAGIGLAVEERGLEDNCVIGTSLPSIAGQYLETGAVDAINFWDPADAGYLMQKIAVMLLKARRSPTAWTLASTATIRSKLDGKVIYGQAWVDVTKENADKYSVLSRDVGRGRRRPPAEPSRTLRNGCRRSLSSSGGHSKVFAGVKSLHDVSLAIQPGEIPARRREWKRQVDSGQDFRRRGMPDTGSIEVDGRARPTWQPIDAVRQASR